MVFLASSLQRLLLAQFVHKEGDSSFPLIAKSLSSHPLLRDSGVRPINDKECEELFNSLLRAEGLERQPSTGIGADVEPSPSVIKLTEILYLRYRKELIEKVREDEHNYRQYLREIEEIGRGEWDHRLKDLEAVSQLHHDGHDEDEEFLHIDDSHRMNKSSDEKKGTELNLSSGSQVGEDMMVEPSHITTEADQSPTLEDLEMKDIIEDLPAEDLVSSVTKFAKTHNTSEPQSTIDGSIDPNATIENTQDTGPVELSSSFVPNHTQESEQNPDSLNSLEGNNDSTVVVPNETTTTMIHETSDARSESMGDVNETDRGQLEITDKSNSEEKNSQTTEATKNSTGYTGESLQEEENLDREDAERTISPEATEASENEVSYPPSSTGMALRSGESSQHRSSVPSQMHERLLHAVNKSTTETSETTKSETAPAPTSHEKFPESSSANSNEVEGQASSDAAGDSVSPAASLTADENVHQQTADDTKETVGVELRAGDVSATNDDEVEKENEQKEPHLEELSRVRTRSLRRQQSEQQPTVEKDEEREADVGEEQEVSAKGEVDDAEELEDDAEEEVDVGPRTRNVRKRRHSAANVDSSPRLVEDKSSPATPTGNTSRSSNRKFQTVVAPLLSNISSNRSASFFTNPVNENDAPNYHSLIYRPTDLRTIKAMVKDGRIQNSGELEREIMRMFANAVMYNRWDSDISKWSREMQRETETLLAVFRGAERRGQTGNGSQPPETKRRKK